MNDLVRAVALDCLATGALADARMLTGAQWLLEALVACGVDTVFGYPGGAALPIYDALYDDARLRHVLVRHEQAAVHAAEGYARSTGRAGVVLVTSGPGVGNTITGLLDALGDSIPVICISGQVATASLGTDAFQECDALGLSRPATKWNIQLRRAEDVFDVVQRAFAIATSGRPGPVLVDFPKDLQGATAARKPSSQPPRWTRKNLSHPGNSVREAVRLLRSAQRPVFYGGGGLINSGDRACLLFTQLVRRMNAPCTLTLMGLGAFPASDRRFLGMLGMHGTLEANLAMHHADLIVCVGARFDDRVTGTLDEFSPGSRKIHIDIDPSSINKRVKVDVPMVGDCARRLDELLEELRDDVGDGAAREQWWSHVARWRSARCLDVRPDTHVILPQKLITALRDAIEGRDAIVTTDVGQHQMWAAQYLRFDRPRQWLTSGAAGTMGYGLPAAIGAQIAHPDRLVVCISGDASVLMNIQELSTAVQHKAQVKLVLSNNGCMGMVRQWQQLNHGGRLSHSWTEALPDFVMLARAFGWGARAVHDPADLDASIAECLAHDGPFFLDVRVAQQENCFPMIASGSGHARILLQRDRCYADEVAM
jgi:acetolactate synthase I/II/III large subunit